MGNIADKVSAVLNGHSEPEATNTAPLKTPNTASSRVAGDPLTLPPGCTSSEFQEFIIRARTICGEENVTVLADSAQLSKEHYMDPSKVHDMHNVYDKEYFIGSAIICPRGVPDVQDIMRLCNEKEIPVWPFSIGRKQVILRF